MQRIVRVTSVLFLAAFCIFALAGCGKKGVIVKGKLVLPPNLPVEKGDLVSITFVPQEKDNKGAAPVSYSEDDHTFEAKGHDGKGIIPGKYTVTLSVVVAPGTKDINRAEALQKFSKKFGPADSPLSFEVTPETTTITVDTVAKTITNG